MKRTMTVVAFAISLVAGYASAATIEGYFSGNATATNTYDLTVLGSEDWVYWGKDASGGTPSNSKSGGTLIGNAMVAGTGGFFRPSTNSINTTFDFTFTDGSDPESGTVSKPSGVANSAYTANSNGVSVVIDLPSTNTYQITIFVSGYDTAAGTLTASLSGATDYVNAEYQDGSSSAKDSAFFTLFVTADNAGDDLTIEFIKGMDNPSRGYDFLILGGVAVGMAPSSSLEGSFSGNASATGTYNLSALGKEDWAYWNTGSTGGTPSNTKDGGALISDVFVVGTGSSLGRPSTGIATTLDFTYADGSSPTSGTVSKPSGVFNTTANVVGNGVGVTIDLPTVDEYIVSVFVAGFYADGRFTADLPGAPQYVNTEFHDASGGDKECAIFTLKATPRNAGDDITVEFSQITETTSYEFLMFTGVAVRLAPPAGTVILVN